MSTRAILGLLLLLAAAFSGWSLWRNRVASGPERPDSGRSEYVLHDFELIALDKAGKESFTVRAPQLQETPGAKSMELTTPLFLLPDDEGQYWQVRSKTGWVSDKRDEIRLRGNVVAKSGAGAQRTTTMKTQQLNVFPDTHRATSAVLVTVVAPGSTMRGTGMKADLAGKRIQLLSKVKLTDEPSRR